MGKVTLSVTMSIDSFTAGKMISQENPMGLKGKLLHKWLFANKQKEDEEVALDMFKDRGAVILGSKSRTFYFREIIFYPSLIHPAVY